MKTYGLGRYALPFLCLTFFATLIACDRMDSQVDPVSPTHETDPDPHPLSPSQMAAFDREAIALKGQVSDPDSRENALQDLRARFGIPAQSAEPFFPTIPDYTQDPAPALSKAAATEKWSGATMFSDPFPFTVVAEEVVAKYTKLTITTKRIDASLDPVLVVFHRPFLQSANKNYVHVLAVIDDVGSSLEPSFTWTNPNDVSTRVYMVMYAYGSGYTGRGSLTYNIYGLTTKVSGRVNAVSIPLTKYFRPAKCTGPSSSGIKLRLTQGKYGGAGALLVNTQTIYGAHVRDVDYDVNMFEVVEPDIGNFMIPYLIDKDNGFSNIDNRYKATWINLFSCP